MNSADANVNQDPTTIGLQTRPSNAAKHPGKIVTDQIRHRRTHSEVVAERAAIQEQKATEAEEKLARIRQVAAIQLKLEDKMVRF